MRRGLRRWHRRFGIVAAAFLAWLAVSGVAINHSHLLGLDRTSWNARWLLALYGLNDAPATGFVAEGHALVGDLGAEGQALVGTQLDGKTLNAPIEAPIGMVAGNGLLFVATPSSVVLLTPDGERVEELRPPTLPIATLRKIGTKDGRVVIQGEHGAYASLDGESWSENGDADVAWSQPSAVKTAAPQASVKAEQVLLDAHSGRLFGPLGPVVIDLVALCALVLAITGTLVWWRSTPRHHHPPTGR